MRGLSRNSDARNGVYKTDLAQRKYEQRLKEKPKKISFIEAVKNKEGVYYQWVICVGGLDCRNLQKRKQKNGS